MTRRRAETAGEAFWRSCAGGETRRRISVQRIDQIQQRILKGLKKFRNLKLKMRRIPAARLKHVARTCKVTACRDHRTGRKITSQQFDKRPPKTKSWTFARAKKWTVTDTFSFCWIQSAIWWKNECCSAEFHLNNLTCVGSVSPEERSDPEDPKSDASFLFFGLFTGSGDPL